MTDGTVVTDRGNSQPVAEADRSAPADALLDSLFADEAWNDSARPAETKERGAPGAITAVGTAQPPAVNPQGHAPREPFSKSPGAPAASERKPLIITSGQRSSQPPSQGPAPSRLSLRAPPKPAGYTPPPPRTSQTPPIAGARWTDTAAEQQAPWFARSRGVSEQAAWLQARAETETDPLRKGRLLLVISELWAGAGEPALALKAAQGAASLLPNSALAHRQLRQLCVLERDVDGALAALEVELRYAKAQERAALLALRVNLHLHRQQDAVSLELALSELQEASPNDPRPALYQLVQQLGFGVHAPDPLTDREPVPAGIARATEQVRRFREALTSAATSDSGALPVSPSLLFHRAQVAVNSGNAPVASQALLSLAQIPALTLSAKWLAAAFTSTQAGTGSAHFDLLHELSAPSGDGIAARALVREALQTGNDEQVRGVLHASPEGTFSDLERLTLGALMFAPAQLPSAWIEPLNAPEQSPLRNALRAVLGLKLPEGDTPASELLGRMLASGATLTPENLEALTHERPWVAMLLMLEQDQKSNNRAEIVRGLLQWAEQPGFALLNYFAALLCELDANPQRAVSICQKMLALDPGFEPASRMLKELGTPSTVAALELLAEHCDEPERAGLLLLEAAEQALATGADNDAAALLSAAVQKSPALPFGYQWAKRLTAKCAEPQFVLDWYERERSRGLSEGSLAALGIRTALALAASSPPDATRLLAELALRFPTDLALQFLGESIAKGSWQDFRERSAGMLPNADRQGLLCEIALDAHSADLRRAVGLAEQALHFDDRPFTRALHQHLADQLADPQWVAQVQQLADASVDTPSRGAVLERSASLAAVSGNVSQVQHAWMTLLTQDPNHLVALLGLQHLQISTAAQTDLNATEARLALLLDEEDALAQGLLQLCAPARITDARPLVQSASQQATPHIAVLRNALALALMDEDRRQEFTITCKLLEREHGPEDTAALSLRAAEIAYDLGLAQQTFDLAQHALSAVPNHTIGLALQAQSHRRWEHWSEAAQSLSAFAATSRLPAHRAGALTQAGLLWLNQLGDAERGEAALEEALRLLPPERETEVAALTERLAQHYDATQQRLKLIELLDVRLARTSDEAQQKRLQALLSKAREEVGATPRPRSVAPKVDASPEHHDALETFARRAFGNGDIKAAEGAWLQLVRTVHEPSKQAEYYRNLGQLYQAGQLNLERALVCYAEVRKRLPNDVGVIEKLISLYEQLRQAEPAITLQMDLLSGARDDLERRKWTIRLAHLYSTLAHDVEHAELTLQQARKTWPHDADVLRALCQLYQNSNQQAALQLLLDRASREARNQLTQGMLELQPFDTLLTIAELSGKQAAAEIIAAARGVLQGRSLPAPGLGPLAVAPRVEKFLLPEAIPPALRALLSDVGSALDSAVAQDLPQLTTTPLHTVDPQLAAECAEVARSFGVESIEFFVSNDVGTEAVAHNSSPPQLVFGQKLLTLADRPLLLFFLHRGLRAISARCCALLRGSGADAQLRLWALLCCFAPDWQPPGMSRDLIQPLSDKISARLPSPLPNEATLLASEVIQTFASRATQLNALLERWVMRTALLASGDPWLALRAVAALATGTAALPGQGVPDGGAERARFIANTNLARDLLLFCTTDECAAAREQAANTTAL